MKKLLLGLLLLGLYPLAIAAEFRQGTEYVAIDPAPPIGKGETVEVMEFFMYSCPHCNRLEPILADWLKNKPDNVEFVRVPAMFGGPANMHAGAFYALEIMGESERLHDKWFKEIHENKNGLRTRDELEAFLEREGVDMDKFRAAMSSFTVQTKAKRAATLLRRYDIRGVPSLVIDGRYKNDRLSSYQQYTELADFLVAKVLQERKSGQ